ncbi:MAG: DinB family protein [Gemmatimonadales bacterium]
MPDPAAAALIDLFNLDTRLFGNCLADLSDAQAGLRPNEHTNSVAFIAGHLVETRAWMARYVGLDCPSPFGGVLEHATSIDQIPVLPSLEAIRAGWDEVSPRVAERLEAMTPADLAAPSSQRFPGVANTVLGGIAFLVKHESYHIGQLAYLRKYLGLPAMSYR